MRHSIIDLDNLLSQVILTPERYDPSLLTNNLEGSEITNFVKLSKLSENPKKIAPSTKIVALDTGDTKDGYITSKPITSPSSIKSTKKVLREGDVIISRLRPYLRQIGYVDETLVHYLPDSTPILCSTEFYVLRPKVDKEIAFLVPFLLSSKVQEKFAVSQVGGHHPRFPVDVLLSLKIPEAVLENSLETNKQVKWCISQIREGEQFLQKLVDGLNSDLSNGN